MFPADQRKAHLQDLKANGTREPGKLAFTYKNNPRFEGDIHKVKLDHLIFNQFNTRIFTELKTYQSNALGEVHEYDEALEDKIKDILWAQGGINQLTLDDLSRRGQIKAGVVTADGVIVSGNRRAMLLLKAGVEEFKAVILDESYDGNRKLIDMLEASLQNDDVGQEKYSAIAKQQAVWNFYENHKLDWPEILPLMGHEETIPKIKMYYEEYILMLDYLVTIGTPNILTNLRIRGEKGTKEEAFRETNKNYKRMIGNNANLGLDWAYDEDDADKYKEIMYDYIRAYNLGAPANFRKIGPGASNKKGILSNEDLFKEFYAKHIEITHPATQSLKDLSEYADLPECESLEPDELANRRESDWTEEVSDEMLRNFDEFVAKVEALAREKEPAERIRKALELLEGLGPLENLKDSENPALVKDQVNEIDNIIRDIKNIFINNA